VPEYITFLVQRYICTVLATATFNDVERNSAVYTYIETAYYHQIISGYDFGGPDQPRPGKYFRPGNNATHGQIAKIVFNAVSNLPCTGDGW